MMRMNTTSYEDCSWDDGTYFHVVAEVSESWDKVRRIEDYEQLVGKLTLQKVFNLDPNTMQLFGLPKNSDPYSVELYKNPRIQKCIVSWVRMLDLSIHVLGPDLDLVEETLMDVGTKNEMYGVKPEHYPIICQALLFALDGICGGEFGKRERVAWSTMFEYMTGMMIQGSCMNN